MDAFLGEIRMMAFGITPKGWAPCQGQLLPINQNAALYSLLGTQYGGNGVSTFALPDLRGQAIVGFGTGTGLSSYPIGTRTGQETVSLTQAQMPAHNHTLSGTLRAATAGEDADGSSPAGNYPSSPEDSTTPFSTGGTVAAMGATALSGQTGTTGNGAGHENRQPFMAMNYCIALTGYFPSRG